MRTCHTQVLVAKKRQALSHSKQLAIAQKIAQGRLPRGFPSKAKSNLSQGQQTLFLAFFLAMSLALLSAFSCLTTFSVLLFWPGAASFFFFFSDFDTSGTKAPAPNSPTSHGCLASPRPWQGSSQRSKAVSSKTRSLKFSWAEKTTRSPGIGAAWISGPLSSPQASTQEAARISSMICSSLPLRSQLLVHLQGPPHGEEDSHCCVKPVHGRLGLLVRWQPQNLVLAQEVQARQHFPQGKLRIRGKRQEVVQEASRFGQPLRLGRRLS